MDCSLPGSSVHRIFQARILGWVAISFSNCKAARPQILKEKDKPQLPGFGCTTGRPGLQDYCCNHFLDWLHQCFFPEARQYLASKEWPFKVFLIWHNALATQNPILTPKASKWSVCPQTNVSNSAFRSGDPKDLYASSHIVFCGEDCQWYGREEKTS